MVTSDALALPTSVRLPVRSDALRWGVDPGDTVLVGGSSLHLGPREVRVVRRWRPSRVTPVPATLPATRLASLAEQLDTAASAGRAAADPAGDSATAPRPSLTVRSAAVVRAALSGSDVVRRPRARARGGRRRPDTERRRRPVRRAARAARCGRRRCAHPGARRGQRRRAPYDEPVRLPPARGRRGLCRARRRRPRRAPSCATTPRPVARPWPRCWPSATPRAATSSPGSPVPCTSWPLHLLHPPRPPWRSVNPLEGETRDRSRRRAPRRLLRLREPDAGVTCRGPDRGRRCRARRHGHRAQHRHAHRHGLHARRGGRPQRPARGHPRRRRRRRRRRGRPRSTRPSPRSRPPAPRPAASATPRRRAPSARPRPPSDANLARHLGARPQRRRRGPRRRPRRAVGDALLRQRRRRGRGRASRTRRPTADVLVMGPDCGTAVVGGVALGFANVVRAGLGRARRRLGHRRPAGHVPARRRRCRASATASASAAATCPSAVARPLHPAGARGPRRRPGDRPRSSSSPSRRPPRCWPTCEAYAAGLGKPVHWATLGRGPTRPDRRRRGRAVRGRRARTGGGRAGRAADRPTRPGARRAARPVLRRHARRRGDARRGRGARRRSGPTSRCRRSWRSAPTCAATPTSSSTSATTA